MIIGYANGTDSTIDISSYFSDSDNHDVNINFTSFLFENLTIDNNIFGYIPDNQIKLISIPEEIFLYQSNNTETPLTNNSFLNINESFTLMQNKNLTKTSEYYYIYYQYIIREPDYDDLYNNAHSVITYPDNDNSYNYQAEYEPRKFYGKANRLKFKLCHEFCDTCNELSTSNNDQKCSSCLSSYQYDYWFYSKNDNNFYCVPEGYYYDKENNSLIL